MAKSWLETFDSTKPYCGNCGAQGVPLRKLPYRGCDDDQHVCKDLKACKARREATKAS